MSTLIRSTFAVAAITTIAALSAGSAQAVSQSRSFYSNPVGLCQAALPAFEGQIRKRPLAVQNEGTSNAFVTCAFTSQQPPKSIRIYFGSADEAAHDVSCTGVTGYGRGANQYSSKTVTLQASGVTSSIVWVPSDFAGGSAEFPSPRFSISCNLLPGVAIYDSQLDFVEDVGS